MTTMPALTIWQPWASLKNKTAGLEEALRASGLPFPELDPPEAKPKRRSAPGGR